MRVVTGLLVAVIVVGFCAAGAEAGKNDSAALLLGVSSVVTKTNCTSLAKSTCAEISPNGSYTGGNCAIGVYVGRDVVGADSLRVAAVDFGVYHSGLFINSWTSCGDLEAPFEGWPNSGVGNSVTWGAPKTGLRIVIVGWFSVYVYAGGTMTVGDHPAYGVARALDDVSIFDDLKRPAIAVPDGQGGGSNPDCTTGVVRTTWGQVKSLYQN